MLRFYLIVAGIGIPQIILKHLQPSHSVSDLNSNISLAEDWEHHPLLQSTQGTTLQDVPSTSEFQDLNPDNLRYDDDDSLDVSNPYSVPTLIKSSRLPLLQPRIRNSERKVILT